MLRSRRENRAACMYAGRLLAARRSTSIQQAREIQPQEEPRKPISSKSRRLRRAETKARIPEERLAWDSLQRILCHQRVINVVNVIVFIALSWNTIMLILGFLTVREQRISASVRSSLAAFAKPQPQSIPGCGSVRHATFRDKYPSTTLSRSGTFDAVYVISNTKCNHWEEFKRRAKVAELSVTKWPMLNWRSISLESPPMELSRNVRERLNPRKRSSIKTLKRQLVYLDAHRRVWEAVANKSSQRVLVVDEALFPSQRLLASLPPMMTNIDVESIAQRRAWHVVQFRRIGAKRHKGETWSRNPVYHHAVVRANASLGAGMYSLSLHGARYLLQNVKEYRAPLDVEFGLLQVEDEEFVALSGCNNDKVKPFCPEMVDAVQGEESMECLWRRFWEAKNVEVFEKLRGS